MNIASSIYQIRRKKELLEGASACVGIYGQFTSKLHGGADIAWGRSGVAALGIFIAVLTKSHKCRHLLKTSLQWQSGN